MSSLTLLGLPLEVRLSIFKYLFHGAEVEVAKDLTTDEIRTCVYVNKQVLHTCKQLYLEARPVIWSSIELSLTFVALKDLARTIDPSHWPSIQHLNLEFEYDWSFDLTPFTALRRLTLTHDEAPDISLTAFLFPKTNNRKTFLAFMQGALDEQLKQKSKALLSKTWIKKIVTSPHRSFEVFTSATAFYDRNASWVVSGWNGLWRVRFETDTEHRRYLTLSTQWKLSSAKHITPMMICYSTKHGIAGQ